jgi:two-component system chemotaxis response regulator CheY
MVVIRKPARRSEMRALIVAEGETLRSVLRDALRAARFQVVEAAPADAMETLDALRDFDVAFIDWWAGGVDFVRRIRAERDYASLRLIMVAPEFHLDSMLNAVKAGVDTYLIKPFTAATLVGKLNELGLRVKGTR